MGARAKKNERSFGQELRAMFMGGDDEGTIEGVIVDVDEEAPPLGQAPIPGAQQGGNTGSLNPDLGNEPPPVETLPGGFSAGGRVGT